MNDNNQRDDILSLELFMSEIPRPDEEIVAEVGHN